MTPTPDPVSTPATGISGAASDHRSVRETVPAGPARRWWWALLGSGLLAAALTWLGVHWYQQLPPQRFRRALQALDHDDMAGIRRELNGWPSTHEYDPHRHFLTGALLYRDGKFAVALEEFRRSLQHPDLRVRTLTMVGGALYRMGAQADAIAALEQAVAADDSAVDAHRLLASSYYDLGVTQQALLHLNRVAELDASDPRPHRLIGLMHKDFEHYPEAIQAYQESLRRSENQPDIQEVWLELAECQVKQRQYDEARRSLAACQPGANKLVLEAECIRATGAAQDALRLVDQALAAEPDNLNALSLRGTLLLEDSHVAEAVAAFETAVERHPYDYPARFKLSQALQRSGEADAAAEQSRRAAELKKRYEHFTELHERAANHPGDVQVRFELGRTAQELGRNDLAVGWFRMALALDPNHRPSRQALEELSSPPDGVPPRGGSR